MASRGGRTSLRCASRSPESFELDAIRRRLGSGLRQRPAREARYCSTGFQRLSIVVIDARALAINLASSGMTQTVWSFLKAPLAHRGDRYRPCTAVSRSAKKIWPYVFSRPSVSSSAPTIAFCQPLYGAARVELRSPGRSQRRSSAYWREGCVPLAGRWLGSAGPVLVLALRLSSPDPKLSSMVVSYSLVNRNRRLFNHLDCV
jgi:hypothetical protein